jgi:SAM-dependent methyltransferase
MTESIDWDPLRKNAAGRHGGSSAVVHQDDLLWRFIAGLTTLFPAPADVADYYFSDGAKSARMLAAAIDRHSAGGPLSIMEFAAGYGMVTRHLRRVLPNAAITSCDIHEAAVEFLQTEIGVSAVLSEHRPEDLQFAQQYDVVFALSFFSHMPESSFGRWLGALYRNVKPGGLFIFTTHGLASRPNLGDPEIPESGIWFKPLSEQHDIEGAEYGSTLSTPEFVIRELYANTAAPLAEFKAGYWWQHQDLYLARKPCQ